MNTVLLSEIEQRIAQLSPDERAFLITRLVHDKDAYRLPDAETMRREIAEMAQDPDIQRELKSAQDKLADEGYRLLSRSDSEQLQREFEEMANDPEIQREIKAINEEFACTEMDGLE